MPLHSPWFQATSSGRHPERRQGRHPAIRHCSLPRRWLGATEQAAGDLPEGGRCSPAWRSPWSSILHDRSHVPPRHAPARMPAPAGQAFTHRLTFQSAGRRTLLQGALDRAEKELKGCKATAQPGTEVCGTSC